MTNSERGSFNSFLERPLDIPMPSSSYQGEVPPISVTDVTSGGITGEWLLGKRGVIAQIVNGVKRILLPFQDWSTLNHKHFSYASGTTATILLEDGYTFLQPGDKVKLVQNGTTKYFYVINSSSTVLTLNGGNEYTLTNHEITSIEYASNTTPTGFPGKFSYTPTLAFNGGTGAIHASTALEYSMNKNLVEISGVLVVSLGAGFSGNIEASYPFPLRDGISTQRGQKIGWGQPGASEDLTMYSYGIEGISGDLTAFLISNPYGAIVDNNPLTQSFFPNFSYFY